LSARVGIVGVGYEGFRPAITDISARELMFQAASKAYIDAGVDPRRDVGSFISCTEDLWEGWSIADEMIPDQIGGARRPVCTVPADAITGLGHAIMHIRSGVADVVAVEAHSKVADVIDKNAVENLALEPIYLRELGANNDVLAGIEMSWFLEKSGFDRQDCSLVVKREKSAALRNPRSCFGANLTIEEVDDSEPLALPLRRYDKPDYAEASVVLVLASEPWIRKHKKEAVYIEGLAWRSSTPWFEGGSVAKAGYAELAFKSALRQSGMRGLSSLDLLEVDDGYSYKLLQHLASIGLSRRETMALVNDEGRRLNPSGGSLGSGNLIEASAAHRLLECVLQLTGRAGENQLKGAEKALALSWRGSPTATGAVAILSK
jgi:acetyl-CoA C-acetyltransferase